MESRTHCGYGIPQALCIVRHGWDKHSSSANNVARSVAGRWVWSVLISRQWFSPRGQTGDVIGSRNNTRKNFLLATRLMNCPFL
ncbi:hypothetical protein RRG08_017038 [Elysia crispata]|uniref:Uncharacterized protein n=1 Tax=Elysia crispata TaxID=231223 RepID=A0AAE0XYT7_9GAST|nr:hypothetical protein RRG08_017038 [Elysia crispata]